MLERIFEPITINKLKIKNRLIVPAMVSFYCSNDGMATEQYIAYHEAKAKGGWGLIIAEDYRVSPHVGASRNLPGLFTEEHVKSHSELTRRVHEAGGLIFAQIYHAGMKATRDLYGIQPVAVSEARSVNMSELPHILTVGEIHDIERDFAKCAVQAKKAGFDGVEIHGTHGYLINQFLSHATNKRSDQYGGTLYNRCRMAIETVKAVRAAVGNDFPISFRLTTKEYFDQGITLEESKVFAMLLEEAGVDVLNCSQNGAPYIIPPSSVHEAFAVNNAEAIKKVVHIPVIGVGRINDPLLAEEAIVSNKMDIVAMGRASLADPDMPNKAKEGRLDDIVHCIACTQGCIGEKVRGGVLSCLVNPSLGHESDTSFQILPTEQKKKVFVIGGGISGCEVAIVAAQKGHDVTLFEKTNVLGGLWNAASMPPDKSEFASLVAYQHAQLKKLGIHIRYNTTLTKENLEDKPDVIVIAIGGKPFVPPISGLENYKLASDVLLEREDIGKNVLVVGGGLAGAETAEYLGANGIHVTLVEVQDQIAKDGEAAPKQFLFKNLEKYGVDIYTSTNVEKINDSNVIIKTLKEEIILNNVDDIIIAAGFRPNTELDKLLLGFNGRIIKVGDANMIKNGLNNLREAYEFALTI